MPVLVVTLSSSTVVCENVWQRVSEVQASTCGSLILAGGPVLGQLRDTEMDEGIRACLCSM